MVIANVGFTISNSNCTLYERAYCIMEEGKARVLEGIIVRNPEYFTEEEHNVYEETCENLQQELEDSGVLDDISSSVCWIDGIDSCDIAGKAEDGAVMLDGKPELTRIVFNHMT